MEKQKKNIYKAPDLTVVSFQVEKGYSVSDPFFAFGLWSGNSGDDAESGGEGLSDFTYDTDNGGFWNWGF